MPSQRALPTLTELLDAFRAGVHGTKDATADMHRGSNYDVWAGTGALLFLRQAVRDRDIFRAIYFDHAEGDDLDVILEERESDARIDAAAGTGFAYLHRPTFGGADGTFWRGTRIELLAVGNQQPRTFLVATDTPAGPTDTVAMVPVESDQLCGGQATDSAASATTYARIADPLWDNSWIVNRLVCGPDTAREQDQDARARVRQRKVDSRVGYIKAITQACEDQGATNVALFASDFFGTNPAGGSPVGALDGSGFGDVGLNRVFVADDSFTADEALLRRCRAAMAAVTVLGTNVQVQGTAPSYVQVNLTVRLWDDPGKFDRASIAQETALAVQNYFDTRQNAFYFKQAAIGGAVTRSVRHVQSITFEAGTTPEPILTHILNSAPLARYTLPSSAAVQVTVAGPA